MDQREQVGQSQHVQSTFFVWSQVLTLDIFIVKLAKCVLTLQKSLTKATYFFA